MTGYEVKLRAGGRDNEYLSFYMPRDIVDNYNLKAGQTIYLDDDQKDGIILMIINREEDLTNAS